MPQPPRPLAAPDRFARLHHAINQALPTLTRPSPVTAPQTPPNNAKARQTTPPTPPVQNKPTAPCTPAAPRPKKSQNVPIPAAHPAPSTRQTVPNPANARHQPPACKTNPPPPAPSSILNPPSSHRPHRPPRPLTPNQLRAARLLIAGHSTTAIAASLSINRHTLAAWKAKPLFQLELRRLLQPTFDTPASPP